MGDVQEKEVEDMMKRTVNKTMKKMNDIMCKRMFMIMMQREMRMYSSGARMMAEMHGVLNVRPVISWMC